MNLLLLTDGITPFTKGGMQRHSQLMAEYLARLGHQITIYHCVAPEKVNDIVITDAFSPEAVSNIELVTFEYQDTGKLPGHYVRAQKRLSKAYFEYLLTARKEYDFIYTKGFSGWELLHRKSELNFRTPIGVKFHGMNMYQPQANWKLELQKYLLRPVVKTIMNKSDYVFSYGGKITEIIKLHTSTPIIEIPTGIEESWMTEEAIERTGVVKFLFVGRFDRVKGLPELYKALETLSQSSIQWECHFVGPIPKEHQLAQPNCIYHGAVYNTAVLKKHYDFCDVLVNTSISEGMPNVVLEAMARGLAVLATDVGATSLLVKNDVNGQLISDPSPMLIHQSMLHLLSLNREKLTLLQQKSQEMVKNYRWTEIAPKLVQSFQNVT